MGKGERPQAQVGGGVGNCRQDVLDGVDALMDHSLPEGKLLVVAVASGGGRRIPLWLWTEAKLLGQFNVLRVLVASQRSLC